MAHRAQCTNKELFRCESSPTGHIHIPAHNATSAWAQGTTCHHLLGMAPPTQICSERDWLSIKLGSVDRKPLHCVPDETVLQALLAAGGGDGLALNTLP